MKDEPVFTQRKRAGKIDVFMDGDWIATCDTKEEATQEAQSRRDCWRAMHT